MIHESRLSDHCSTTSSLHCERAPADSFTPSAYCPLWATAARWDPPHRTPGREIDRSGVGRAQGLRGGALNALTTEHPSCLAANEIRASADFVVVCRPIVEPRVVEANLLVLHVVIRRTAGVVRLSLPCVHKLGVPSQMPLDGSRRSVSVRQIRFGVADAVQQGQVLATHAPRHLAQCDDPAFAVVHHRAAFHCVSREPTSADCPLRAPPTTSFAATERRPPNTADLARSPMHRHRAPLEVSGLRPRRCTPSVAPPSVVAGCN